MPRIRSRATILFEVDGEVVVDEKLAKLLMLIDEEKSILAASRTLKLAYSRAWESIMKAERKLGVKLVEVRRGGRGGGGAVLTSYGRKLLNRYLREYRVKLRKKLTIKKVRISYPELVYAGSNDLLLERIFGLMREKGFEAIDVAWIGSSGGLMALMLREADLAGIHLYDPTTGKYNIPYLSRYWLEDIVIVIRGYDREIGFVSREPLNDPLKTLIEGGARLINRNLGSGTRVYLDQLLKKEAEERGASFQELAETIKGFKDEVRTHLEVVKAIIDGKADVGLTIRFIAEKHGLHFKHVTWEKFDFVILKDRFEKRPIQEFIKMLKSDAIKGFVEKMTGYRIPEDSGRVIYGE
ncbi:MAG: MolR family transcriptional regulator [Thaumarchaeota archaeon]|nr:MAG: MolR family transcriptional regulator [Nitrososphaerota archaeon]